MKKVVFLAGVGTAYLIGTPSGRRQLEKFKVWANDVWHDPRVQEYVQEYEGKATEFAKQQGAALWEKAVDTASGVMSGSTTKYDDVVGEPYDEPSPGRP
ncbi:YtxH domain-containing protein [Cellulomonas sp. P5_C6]